MSIHLMHRHQQQDILAMAMQGPAIPAGAIFPYVAAVATLPAGWDTLEKDAVSFYGSTYFFPRLMGSTDREAERFVESLYSLTVSTVGAHAVASNNYCEQNARAGNLSAGAHNHVLESGNIGRDAALSVFLAQAQEATDILPASAMWLKNDNRDNTPEGWTRSYNSAANKDSHILAMDGDQTTPATYYYDAYGPFTYQLANDGAHNHGLTDGDDTSSDGGGNLVATDRGIHSQSVSLSITNLQVRKILLNAWYRNPLGDYNLHNAVKPMALWPYQTPPIGWLSLDGTRGTQDLVDLYPYVAYDINDGGVIPTQDGKAQSAASALSTATGIHQHFDSQHDNCDRNGRYHKTDSGTHQHTCSIARQLWKPHRSFYQLIQRLW